MFFCTLHSLYKSAMSKAGLVLLKAGPNRFGVAASLLSTS